MSETARAAETVAVEELEFPSHDGRSTIRGRVWRPAGGTAPRAAMLLVHGMAEHIARYDDFARHLASHGVLVAGHDQLGHGDSCDPSHWGEMPLRGGADDLVEDVHALRGLIEGELEQDVPVFVFGHSMGSFIVRSYIARHGQGLAGAIICGTGYLPRAASVFARDLTWAIAFVRGESHRSRLVDSLGVGAYGKAVPDAQTDLDWLSHDRGNVERYQADPACGFMFSVGGYHAVAELTLEVNDPECAARVPHDLPLLYIAGAEDPVGSCGEGVRQAARLATEAGSTDVTVTIYPGMRHEVLNEADHELVYADVLRWVEAHLAGGPAGQEG